MHVKYTFCVLVVSNALKNFVQIIICGKTIVQKSLILIIVSFNVRFNS